VRAERAVRIAPHEWELEAATVRHFDPASASSPPRTEQASRMTLRVEDDRSPTTLQAEVDALPIWTLAEYVSKRGTPRDRAMFQQRLTGPLLVLLFALLAVPLALRVERTKSLAAPAVQGVGILFVFLLAREYAAAFASSDVSAVALPWLVILVFAGFGLVQLARTPN